MPSRLVIVEDHGLVSETVGTALRAQGYDVHLVDAPTTEDLVGAVTGQDPDLVLLDLDLGSGADALDVLPDLSERDVPVLMMTGVSDPVALARCVRAGAVGIVRKGVSLDRLVESVQQTRDHGTLLTRHEREEHLAVLRQHETEERDRLAPFAQLTAREADVLRALCQGRSVDEIATEAVVSVSTVRTQVRAILRKLSVGSQLAATALARESGWLRRG